jgi:sarcosine oxidase, subunit gamma
MSNTLLFPDVAISHAPAMQRYSLRARDAAVLAAIIARPLPARIGTTDGGIACIGPDEYYARLAAGTPLPRGEGQPVSIVDISDRAVGFTIEGNGALAVLSTGCPLDLSRFAVGRTTRTIFETVEIIVTRERETCWHIDVWRSFAPWLWLALEAAAEG